MLVALCYQYMFVLSFFFFFSSRRRHTRCSRDWSSDVCSSDLPFVVEVVRVVGAQAVGVHLVAAVGFADEDIAPVFFVVLRSEERRVGKECRSRWSPYH